MLKIDWIVGESTDTERPADLELGTEKVKLRQNITRATKTTEEGTVKVWSYEYANMKPEEYEQYKEELAQLETPFAQMIQTQYNTQLETSAEQYEQQLTITKNQAAILEGIADLYEMNGGTQA